MFKISTAPKDRYILLFGNSGYTHVELRGDIGRWNEDKQRWDDHAGDAITDSGEEPVWWQEIPIPRPRKATLEERIAHIEDGLQTFHHELNYAWSPLE